MLYSPEIIGQAFKKDRWGGVCWVSICGQGETLVPKETVQIVYEILKQGHFVNVTTNGTLSKRFDEICIFPKEYRERLHFSFSLHYLELLRLNLLDTFFMNIKKVKDAGCSFALQINLYDGYEPVLDDIRNLCIEKVGAPPQVAATRKEINYRTHVELYTNHTTEEYIHLVDNFESNLFAFTMKNFNKKQRGFCYAGDWSFQLNLADGILRRCYSSRIVQNIFENPESPINFVAMGHACSDVFCVNSSHFLSLGTIPAENTPTYAQLRNRSNAHWYTDRMDKFLNTKLCDSNEFYSFKDKFKSATYHVKEILLQCNIKLRKIIKGLIVKLGLYKTK